MYKLSKTGVIRTSDNVFIPKTEGNRDWIEYCEWVAQGNTADPEHTLEEIKKIRKNEVKEEAVRRINKDAPDFKLLRHKEQGEMSISTTLTDADYKNLLKLRQSIRDASNKIEREIEAMTEIEAVEGLNIARPEVWAK